MQLYVSLCRHQAYMMETMFVCRHQAFKAMCKLVLYVDGFKRVNYCRFQPVEFWRRQNQNKKGDPYLNRVNCVLLYCHLSSVIRKLLFLKNERLDIVVARFIYLSFRNLTLQMSEVANVGLCIRNLLPLITPMVTSTLDSKYMFIMYYRWDLGESNIILWNVITNNVN